MTAIWYHSIFLIALLASFMLASKDSFSGKRGLFLCLILLSYAVCMIAFLPVPWSVGADRTLYARSFIQAAKSDTFSPEGSDYLFGFYSIIVAKLFNWQGCFVVTALIYVANHLIAAYKCSRKHVALLFLLMLSSFSFYSYGVNTIRAGFAASFLLLALVNYKRLLWFFLFIFVAVNCHYSMIIPSLAMIAAKYWNKPKLYIGLWLCCVVASAAAGHYFEQLFAGMSSDHRVSYLNVEASETHYKVGFRIDFVLYSMLPMVAGYYYLVKKQIRSEFYSILFNTYILANCFWLLVIRANFSDRFAYLSWFLYPLVLVYPMCHFKVVKQQPVKMAIILLCSASFTYFMFIR